MLWPNQPKKGDDVGKSMHDSKGVVVEAGWRWGRSPNCRPLNLSILSKIFKKYFHFSGL